MLFVAAARIRDFLIFFAAGTVAMSFLAITSPYRMQRLTGFLDPWSDPYNSGFQLTQSLIAIGRGEWFGVGLGNSVQKLFYLPEAHTDFVFAVYAEEFGLAGSCVLIGLFAALLWRIFRLGIRAMESDRSFEACLAIGVGTWLGLQSFINLGVNMGILPTKGLTLPLISSGGSSMLMVLLALGSVYAQALLLTFMAVRRITPTGRRPRRPCLDRYGRLTPGTSVRLEANGNRSVYR